jgi:hypothetical protein
MSLSLVLRHEYVRNRKGLSMGNAKDKRTEILRMVVYIANSCQLFQFRSPVVEVA